MSEEMEDHRQNRENGCQQVVAKDDRRIHDKVTHNMIRETGVGGGRWGENNRAREEARQGKGNLGWEAKMG
jgi:hypothetical protein